ncbi:MAG: M56 family metallopeptidase [Bacteroidaceae bacterium]|nr:M56 family metallopeptidase [Bacteroidaceae bacterium]
MMETLLVYIGKVAVLLAVFFLFYRCLLAKEAWHRFNRVMLWFQVVLAFALPFCVITTEKVVHVKEMLQAVQVNDGMVMAEERMIAATENPIDGMTILFGIYVVGVCVTIVWILISIARVYRIIRCSERRWLERGVTLVLTEKQTEPFSWMHFVVMSRKDYETGNRAILLHEQAHVRMFHSVDVLLINLVCALQWFNPAAWLMRKNLKEIHEYEADAATLQSGISLKSYQDLLIKKAVGTSGHSIANSLNHSSLKNRLTMMYLKKSCMRSALKALYALPIVGISMAATAKTIVVYEYDNSETQVASASVDKVMQNSAVVQTKQEESVSLPKEEQKEVEEMARNGVEVMKDTVPDSVVMKVSDHVTVVQVKKEVSDVDALSAIAQDDALATDVAKEFVKKLPGATLDSEEGLKINGKKVKKIVLDGQQVMDAETLEKVRQNLKTTVETVSDTTSGLFIIIDGKTAKIQDFIQFAIDKKVGDMQMYKGASATDEFGEKGKNGVLVVKTKQ